MNMIPQTSILPFEKHMSSDETNQVRLLKYHEKHINICLVSFQKCKVVTTSIAEVLTIIPHTQRQSSGSSRNVVNIVSKRMSLWEEDPFLAAITECTKDLDDYKGKGEIKKNFWTRVHMSKSFLLSCKQSFDVKESHTLMKPSTLGSIFRQERP